jgi:hypothetical protein
VTLDLRDILEKLGPDEVEEIADYLSCNDKIIKNVADQIVEGMTSMGSYGSISHTPEKPSTPLDKAVRQVAEASSDIAKGEIGAMSSRLEKLTEQKDQVTNWAWAMYHAWNDIQRGQNVLFPLDIDKFKGDA